MKSCTKLTSDYGNIYLSELVVIDFVKSIIEEIPEIVNVDSKNVSLTIVESLETNEMKEPEEVQKEVVDLSVSITIQDTMEILKVANELQTRLKKEIPLFLGINLRQVIIQVKKINFKESK